MVGLSASGYGLRFFCDRRSQPCSDDAVSSPQGLNWIFRKGACNTSLVVSGTDALASDLLKTHLRSHARTCCRKQTALYIDNVVGVYLFAT